jgi:hypothetical protein
LVCTLPVVFSWLRSCCSANATEQITYPLPQPTSKQLHNTSSSSSSEKGRKYALRSTTVCLHS